MVVVTVEPAGALDAESIARLSTVCTNTGLESQRELLSEIRRCLMATVAEILELGTTSSNVIIEALLPGIRTPITINVES